MRRSVSSIALLLVCLDWKSNSFTYRSISRSIPKLQYYPLTWVLSLSTKYHPWASSVPY